MNYLNIILVSRLLTFMFVQKMISLTIINQGRVGGNFNCKYFGTCLRDLPDQRLIFLISSNAHLVHVAFR